MRFTLISNFKTVVQHSDGTVRKIRHNPPLPTSTVLEFLAMLLAPARPAHADSKLPPPREPRSEPNCPASSAPPHDSSLVIGYFMVGSARHPLTVLSGSAILQIATGSGGQHLGQFAIELYQEAARVLGYGLTGQPVQGEYELMCSFARTVRDLLPGFRQTFMERHKGATIDGAYSRSLFGTAPDANAETPPAGGGTSGSGSNAGSGSNTESGPAGGGTEDSSGGRRTLPYNQVMAQTIRGVLGLAQLQMNGQEKPNPQTLDFASIARMASEIRRVVTGNPRGGDILPRTAMRILGRALRSELEPRDVIALDDDRLFSMFTHLTVRDEQPIACPVVV